MRTCASLGFIESPSEKKRAHSNNTKVRQPFSVLFVQQSSFAVGANAGLASFGAGAAKRVTANPAEDFGKARLRPAAEVEITPALDRQISF
jgi:hypothetical protein